jgi:putative transposase
MAPALSRNVNHCLSEEIVANAARSRQAIAIEHLMHICKRVNGHKGRNATLCRWSFALRKFGTCKSTLKGMPFVFVDLRNTAGTCRECGSIHKTNRKTQQTFFCTNVVISAACVGDRNVRASGAALVT